MKKLKKTLVYRMLTSGAGRFGTYGVLALSTFLVGVVGSGGHSLHSST
jgi:hypothetical protein